MSGPSSYISFQIPTFNNTIKIPISVSQVKEMGITSSLVKTAYQDEFNAMRASILKITPIVLGLLASIVLSPIWMPIAMISSFLLGPVTWILTGVSGCMLWDFSQKVMQAFDRQCEPCVNYAAAKIILFQKNTSVEDLTATAHTGFSFFGT